MKKSEKGYTLIELLVVITIIGLLGYLVNTSTKWCEEKVLHMKVEEVASAIEYVKEAASATGQNYGLLFGKKQIRVRDEKENLFVIQLANNQSIPNSLVGRYMWFMGKPVSSLSTTIRIENTSIGKCGNIAVRVATSKVRVYYDEI